MNLRDYFFKTDLKLLNEKFKILSLLNNVVQMYGNIYKKKLIQTNLKQKKNVKKLQNISLYFLKEFMRLQ